MGWQLAPILYASGRTSVYLNNVVHEPNSEQLAQGKQLSCRSSPTRIQTPMQQHVLQQRLYSFESDCCIQVLVEEPPLAT